MRDDYKRLFSILPEVNDPPGLLSSVVEIVEKKSLSRAKRRSFVYSTLLIVSVALFVFTIRIFILDFYQSGFYSYFSLIFSDWQTLAMYWRDVGSSLLESLPIVSTGLVLGSVFLFLFSLRALGIYGRNMRGSIIRSSLA